MKIGWQWLLPLAIGNLILSAVFIMRAEVWELLKQIGASVLARFGLG